MRSKKILIGPRKSRHYQTWLDRRFSWSENLQQKQNRIAKSTNLEENAEKIQFLSSEQPCQLKSMDVALDIAGVEKVRSVKLQWRSTLEVIQFEFWMKEALSFSDGANLCRLWFEILKSFCKLVPRFLVDEAKGEIWQRRKICFFDWLLHLTPVQSPLWNFTRFSAANVLQNLEISAVS